MKIIYDHQIFSHQSYGGISRCFADLITAIKKNHSEIECCLPIRFSNNAYIRKIPNAKTYPVLKKRNFKGKARLISYYNQLLTIKFLKQHRDFSIFHPTYHYDYFLPFLNGKPYVITIHDMIMEERKNEIPGSDRYIKMKYKLAENAAAIITPSNYSKTKILEKFKFVDSEKIHVVPHGVPENCSPKCPDLSVPEKFILFVGHRLAYKNFNKLIIAFAKLSKENKDVNLFCAGGGAFSNEELKLLHETNVVDKVVQLDLSDCELAWAYKNAFCYICASSEEGFGIPILEAFSYKCPVTCSNRASLPEVAVDAALYFNPDNINDIYFAISSLLLDAGLRAVLVETGSRRLEAFTSKINCEKVINVYRNVLS